MAPPITSGGSGKQSVVSRCMARTETGHACPCCRFLTLPDPPPGTFFICPVCRWEDDNVQYEDVNYEGGANRMSLRQAQASFRVAGTTDPARSGDARPPLPHERP
jgi:hypothetical protein